jgi:hypothetical protein
MRNGRGGREQQILVAAGAAAAGVLAGVLAASGRRVAVETVESLTGDWFDILTADRLEIADLFDLIDGSKPGNPGRRRRLATRLRLLIERHALREETVLYPAARLAGAESTLAGLTAGYAEIKFVLYQIDHADPSTPEWSCLVSNLRQALERHVAIERNELLPLLREKLTPEAEADLTALIYKTGANLV